MQRGARAPEVAQPKYGLELAVARGCPQRKLSHGADVARVPELVIADAVDSRGWTALHVAANEGYHEVVRVLVGNTNCVWHLLAKRTRFNDSDYCFSQENALEMAIQRGHGKVVEVLLMAYHTQPEKNRTV